MIQSFNHLQKFTGKSVVMRRTYAGWIEFDVEQCEKESIRFKSHMSGFDFSFEGENAVDQFEAYAKDAPIFETIHNARDYAASERSETIRKFTEQYGNDKDAFAKQMIHLAYQSEMDSEYGDYDKAQAIKSVESIHYPEMDLDNDLESSNVQNTNTGMTPFLTSDLGDGLDDLDTEQANTQNQ